MSSLQEGGGMNERNVGLPLALGFISTGAVVAALVASDAIGFAFQTFALLVVLPIGASCAGAACGAGVFAALLWQGKRPTNLHYVLAAIFGGVGFVATYLALYLTTYVDKDLNLSHSFVGMPLRHLMPFSKYLQMTIGGRTSTFYLSIGHVHIPVGGQEGIDLGGRINWISFCLEGIGYLVGGYFVGGLILGDRRYCESCQVYMKSSPMFRTLPENLQAKANALDAATGAGTELRRLVNDEKNTKVGRRAGHVAFVMEFCPRCFDGYLLGKFMRVSSNRWEEVRKNRITVHIEKTTVHDYFL
jgi:hypothetical protein